MQPNNSNQFTENAWATIARTTEIAKTAKQQNIETEHIFKSLLADETIASRIFSRLDVSLDRLSDRTENFMAQQPKLSGTIENIYWGKSSSDLLDRAEQIRKTYQDEYIST